MHLHKHISLPLPGNARQSYLNHGKLNDVRTRPLNGSIHRCTLSKAAHRAIGGGNFRQITVTSEKRPDKSIFARIPDRFIDPRFNPWITFEIAFNVRLSNIHRYSQLLG